MIATRCGSAWSPDFNRQATANQGLCALIGLLYFDSTLALCINNEACNTM
jgi:hypothetical protein